MSIASTVGITTTSYVTAVNISLATGGIRLPRATSGPVLDLDLMTMAQQLRNEAACSDGRDSRTLVKHRDFRIFLTVMRAGAHLHRHHALGTVLILVFSGYIRARGSMRRLASPSLCSIANHIEAAARPETDAR